MNINASIMILYYVGIIFEIKKKKLTPGCNY